MTPSQKAIWTIMKGYSGEEIAIEPFSYCNQLLFPLN